MEKQYHEAKCWLLGMFPCTMDISLPNVVGQFEIQLGMCLDKIQLRKILLLVGVVIVKGLKSPQI